MLKNSKVIVKELVSFIGLVVNAFYAVFEAPLHYRGMERNKLEGLGSDMNFDIEVFLSDNSRQEIQWWSQNVRSKNGKRIRPVKPQKQCQTDASFQGWGAIDLNSNEYAQASWDVSESNHSINYL